MKTWFLVAALAALAPRHAFTQESKHDLKNCIYASGDKMEEGDCEMYRELLKRERAEKAKHDADMARELAEEKAVNQAARAREAAERAAYAKTLAESLAKVEAQRKADEERAAAKREADTAARAEFRAAREREYSEMMQRRQREEDAEARAEARAVAAQKARCGVDYKNPRVGMPIDRVRECVAKLRVDGQINRADGVITTYVTSSGAYFHVMSGRVVAWGR